MHADVEILDMCEGQGGMNGEGGGEGGGSATYRKPWLKIAERPSFRAREIWSRQIRHSGTKNMAMSERVLKVAEKM